MACENMERDRIEAAKKAARKALLEGKATIKKNVLTGRLELSGMKATSKEGCADACIIAGIARQPDMMKYFTTAGITPASAIQAHTASHRHTAGR